MPLCAPTPREVVLSDGSARLLHFPAERRGAPVLLVPSLINRWYVLDLCEGSSVVAALAGAGLDVYLLDWGVPRDEDRYLAWDELVARLDRAVRFVIRRSRCARIGLVGYCLGGTLAAIEAALAPERIGALVNLLGPIEFSAGGALARMADRRWFDAEAVAEAGNVPALQMQLGFVALRPTLELVKRMRRFDTPADPHARRRAAALEQWASDNVPFPAAAYAHYVRSLYQDDDLARGEHRIGGRRVDLRAITAPLLTVVASEDAICPAPAATALHRLVGSADRSVRTIAGGHVGAVVGSRAERELYPALGQWLSERLSHDSNDERIAPCATSS